MVRRIEGEQLAQGRFVDLDDADARSLKLLDLVAQGQPDLVRDLSKRQVIARKGPRDDRHRSRQHALDGLVGEGLRVGGPLDGHGLRACDVSPQDRRAGAARAIGLDPAVAGRGKAVEEFREVLDHVVALGLAMDQDIQADLLLQPDDRCDLGLHPLDVVGVGELPAGIGRAGTADLARLRERSDGRGRQVRQVEAFALRGLACREFLAPAIRLRQGRDAFTDLGPDDAGRLGALGEHPGGLGDLVRHRVPAQVEAAGERDDLADLLVREGQPRVEVAVELLVVPGFKPGVMGDVLQRVRGGDGNPRGPERAGLIEEIPCPGEVGTPDVAAIDGADDEGHAGQVGATRSRQPTAPRVHVDGLDA